MKTAIGFVAFVLLCLALHTEEPKQQLTNQPTKKLIDSGKIDRFYKEVAKLDKWYTTTKRMPDDAQLYKERLQTLIKETEQ